MNLLERKSTMKRFGLNEPSPGETSFNRPHLHGN